MTRESQGDLYVYVARYGTYESDQPEGLLGFTDEEKAQEWALNSNTVLSQQSEWIEKTPHTLRYEDKVGNWAEVDRVRVNDPEGFLAYE